VRSTFSAHASFEKSCAAQASERIPSKLDKKRSRGSSAGKLFKELLSPLKRSLSKRSLSFAHHQSIGHEPSAFQQDGIAELPEAIPEISTSAHFCPELFSPLPMELETNTAQLAWNVEPDPIPPLHAVVEDATPSPPIISPIPLHATALSSQFHCSESHDLSYAKKSLQGLHSVIPDSEAVRTGWLSERQCFGANLPPCIALLLRLFEMAIKRNGLHISGHLEQWLDAHQSITDHQLLSPELSDFYHKTSVVEQYLGPWLRTEIPGSESLRAEKIVVIQKFIESRTELRMIARSHVPDSNMFSGLWFLRSMSIFIQILVLLLTFHSLGLLLACWKPD
jgi:hypothetical protein